MDQPEHKYVKYISDRADSYWWCGSRCGHWTGSFWLLLEETEVFYIINIFTSLSICISIVCVNRLQLPLFAREGEVDIQLVAGQKFRIVFV